MKKKHFKNLEAKRKKTFSVILLVPVLLSVLLIIFSASFKNKITAAKKSLMRHDFDKMPPGCTITSFGHGNGTFSASISFLQPNGKMISSYERSWQGSKLFAECFVFSLKKGNLVFPFRLYSDKAKKGTGTTLFPYYTIDKYPAIYNYTFFSQNEKKIIEEIFKTSRNISVISPRFLTAFRGVTIQTAVLSDFKADANYNLTFDKNGKLIFKQVL